MNICQSLLFSLIGALVGGGILLCVSHTFRLQDQKNYAWNAASKRTILSNVTELEETQEDKELKVDIKSIQVDGSHQKSIDYICYEPTTGLSDPVVTILTENKWPQSQVVENFIRQNRLIYVKQHGYRYCELQDSMDTSRNFIWSRVPFLLSILPCTEYTIHMDGDAIFFNPEFTFDPWIDRMNNEGLDLMMSEDYISISPVNFGVFMVRNSAWTYKALLQVYNRCACDHARMWDWPREQGIVYDWIALHEEDELEGGKKAKVIESKGWNAHFLQKDPLSMDNFVVHFAGCCYHEDENPPRNDQSFDFKYNKMMWYQRNANPNNYTLDMETDFEQSSSFCKSMTYKKLTQHTDYKKTDSVSIWESSLLDYDLTTEGELKHVEVSSIQCTRDMKCSLEKYWDDKKGKKKDPKPTKK